MSQALRKLSGNMNKSKTTCIFINQLREKVGIMFGNPETTPGGRALKFYASVRLDIRKGEQIKSGDTVIGNKVNIKVVKNKVSPPFKLHEVEEYFKSQGFYYERPEIIECYMAMGGVAYYLSLFENNKSVAQNIQQLCFTRGGELSEEFDRLFNSLFKKADNHLAIVTALKNKGKGMTRLDLLDATGLANNGRFSLILKELEQCDFIRSYTPFGKSKKDMMYQLIDPFCLFYFKFMHSKGSFLDNYWLKMQTTAEYESWCGHAFEIVCLHHINEIVKALGIDGSINTPCSWSYRPTAKVMADEETDEDLKHGTQIDLLIDRSDRSISVCEMKYCNGEYEISKAYDTHLAHRLKVFKKVTKTTKTLIPTFITPYGLYNNIPQFGIRNSS